MNRQYNPAGRLHQILEAGQNIQRGTLIGDAWAQLLLVPKGDLSLLVQRLGQVMELPAVIKKQILQIDGINHDMYLRWTVNVEDAFRCVWFNNTWDNFINRIDNANLQGIEFCSDVLSRSFQESVQEQDSLSEFLDTVNELLRELQSNGIDPDLKAYLYRHLLGLRRAIEEYRLFGIKPIEREIESAIGSILIKRDLAIKSKSTDIGVKFWDFLTKLVLVMNLAGVPLQIANDLGVAIECIQ